MLALVLAFALTAATGTVDPRLAEPLQLLADVHDAQGQAVGQRYARLVTVLNLTVVARTLSANAGGYYNPAMRTVMIADTILGEDPRIIAAGLAHELRHASDLDLVAVGLLPPDCLEIEARGFEAQAIVGRAFWPGEMPADNALEAQLARIVTLHETQGLDGIRAWLAHDPRYQRACRARPGADVDGI